jgi:hypothetical protein
VKESGYFVFFGRMYVFLHTDIFKYSFAKIHEISSSNENFAIVNFFIAHPIWLILVPKCRYYKSEESGYFVFFGKMYGFLRTDIFM